MFFESGPGIAVILVGILLVVLATGGVIVACYRRKVCCVNRQQTQPEEDPAARDGVSDEADFGDLSAPRLYYGETSFQPARQSLDSDIDAPPSAAGRRSIAVVGGGEFADAATADQKRWPAPHSSSSGFVQQRGSPVPVIPEEDADGFGGPNQAAVATPIDAEHLRTGARASPSEAPLWRGSVATGARGGIERSEEWGAASSARRPSSSSYQGQRHDPPPRPRQEDSGAEGRRHSTASAASRRPSQLWLPRTSWSGTTPIWPFVDDTRRSSADARL